MLILEDNVSSKPTLRQWAYQLIEPRVTGSKAAKAVDLLLIALIFVNIVAIVLESVEAINNVFADLFQALETFSIVVFSVEYIVRIWTAPEDPAYRRRLGRLRYSYSPMAIVDLLSILPFYLGLLSNFVAIDLRIIRIVRILRVFRILKIGRYLKALVMLEAVLKERKEQIFLSVMFVVFLLVIVSTIMFYVENEAQPETFSSIPATMWWGISTLTTVGYGDMIPQTPIGRLLGGMIAILGIGLFALPAAILTSGITDYFRKKGEEDRDDKYCPHCGGSLNDHSS